jgi:hypothetical protein
MLYSIQELLRKINSRLDIYDCLSIFVTAVIISGFSFYLFRDAQSNKLPITYTTAPLNVSRTVEGASTDSRPFASKSGKTYTFSWCGGSANIKPTNKVYFADEVEAIRSGRRLSKLCAK